MALFDELYGTENPQQIHRLLSDFIAKTGISLDNLIYDNACNFGKYCKIEKSEMSNVCSGRRLKNLCD